MYIDFTDLLTLATLLIIVITMLASPLIIGFFIGLSKGRAEKQVIILRDNSTNEICLKS